jgi:hypothetical protein
VAKGAARRFSARTLVRKCFSIRREKCRGTKSAPWQSDMTKGPLIAGIYWPRCIPEPTMPPMDAPTNNPIRVLTVGTLLLVLSSKFRKPFAPT